MAKKRQRGKLGDSFKTQEEKSPSTQDLKKMLEETEEKPVPKKPKKLAKVKIGTQVDAELYETFREMVKERGMKLGFIIEGFMRTFIEENS